MANTNDSSTTNGHMPLSGFRYLERTGASMPALPDLAGEIQRALAGLAIDPASLRGRRIAVPAGSRGIAQLADIVRSTCAWLKSQGAEPFVFPGMGSHAGGTAEGQREILADYGVTQEHVGAEIRSSMATAPLGPTPEGFHVYMDRMAAEADGVIVVHRVKPHTDFAGSVESGLLKMMAVGMGKIDGAREFHRWARKFGHERVLRAMAGRVIASGRILGGLAVVENELHQIAAVRAARPEGIIAVEEETLRLARRLVPQLPCPKIDLLIVNELGKNISGAGMDTKVIGRGVEFEGKEITQGPEIRLIYVRDLTPESLGNAVGIGLADFMHERLYRKIDLEKTYLNARTSLNPLAARLPVYLRSDRDAFDFALGALGAPQPDDQRVAWIRNTLNLDRVAVSEGLAREAGSASGWRLAPGVYTPAFDAEGNAELAERG